MQTLQGFKRIGKETSSESFLPTWEHRSQQRAKVRPHHTSILAAETAHRHGHSTELDWSHTKRTEYIAAQLLFCLGHGRVQALHVFKFCDH